MRLSEKRVKSLQLLMCEKFGLEMTNEQAQEAGLAIMRFLIAKAERKQEPTDMEKNDNGQQETSEKC